MNSHADDCLGHVFRQLIADLRGLWPGPVAMGVSKGALCQARYRPGARPLAQLFRRICQPLASLETSRGVFGLRLMALDGTILAVPDTPSDVCAFGRQRSPRGFCA